MPVIPFPEFKPPPFAKADDLFEVAGDLLDLYAAPDQFTGVPDEEAQATLRALSANIRWHREEKYRASFALQRDTAPGSVRRFLSPDISFVLVETEGVDSRNFDFQAERLLFYDGAASRADIGDWQITRMTPPGRTQPEFLHGNITNGIITLLHEQLATIRDARSAPDTGDAIVLRPKFGRADQD